jgi:hypothetical protein
LPCLQAGDGQHTNNRFSGHTVPVTKAAFCRNNLGKGRRQ